MLENSEEAYYQAARRDLRYLLLGTDPQTSERLSDECIVRTPEVQRSLSLALDALEDGRRLRAYLKKYPAGRLCRKLQAASERRVSSVKKTASPESAGAPWNEAENGRLVAEFDRGVTVGSLAKIHQRTKGSIAARLVRLGVCASRDEARAGRPSFAKKPPERDIGFDTAHAGSLGAK